mmetsp:Transcript_52320/g.124883  ORF Transcript_52320/g.124883 Transcript_52320/m.124883 type:complete len:223 (+) Transcript_52320:2042-2710(+)
MAQTLHCDADLVCDACEDVAIDKRIVRPVLSTLVVRQGFHKRLRHARVVKLTREIKQWVIVNIKLEHDRRGSVPSASDFCKLCLYELDSVLQLPMHQAHVALAQHVLLHEHLQGNVRPPGFSTHNWAICFHVQPLNETKSTCAPTVFEVLVIQIVFASCCSMPKIQVRLLISQKLILQVPQLLMCLHQVFKLSIDTLFAPHVPKCWLVHDPHFIPVNDIPGF